MEPALRRFGLPRYLICSSTLLASVLTLAAEPAQPIEYREAPRDAPAEYNPRQDPEARGPAADIVFGSFTSVQVNVDAQGQNIVGDAANETSIAVSPVDPKVMVIGWRQFDSITSDFRQAGYAYTKDGGSTWTFPSPLDAGVFRSDPVLDSDSSGNIYYQSLTADPGLTEFLNAVFKSLDGGSSWRPPVPAFGGDKNWMVVDKSGGPGDGFVYGIWQRFFGCCDLDVVTRSIDQAQSFEAPVQADLWPTFGTMAVGPDGEVYAAGIEGTSMQDLGSFVISKSINAMDGAMTPIFNGVRVEMGGNMGFGGGPNASGLLGQVNVAVDSSDGPTRGNVYMLASVDPLPLGESADPLDVHFVRSQDGGLTWTPPIRVNDDPAGEGAWHWFGALSVAPNGRIDAIWNDTRNTGDVTLSQLFYSYSFNAGDTWAPNVPVSPVFDSTVGYPSNNKIGDYYTLVSTGTGANVAYSATFNGEQDVYFVRVFPDCNQNGVVDLQDIALGTSPDCNTNQIPDECELEAGSVADCNGNEIPDACDIAGPDGEDCTGNGILDECEPDCNRNGLADSCDLDTGSSADCSGSGNGIPDECEPDCDANGLADSCDISLGTSLDCNADGIPDVCEADCDGNGVPDPCDTLPTFSTIDITSTANRVQDVATADLDGDGDVDVLSASPDDDRVAWYENLDGLGSFGPTRVVGTTVGDPVSVRTTDIDGDGDPDIVAGGFSPGDVVWYENTDGLGTFGPVRLISSAPATLGAIDVADLDGDGDPDALSVTLDGLVSWYENTDGLGSFGPRLPIATHSTAARNLAAADLDGDGDPDVAVTFSVSDRLSWFENTDGDGTFGPERLVDDDADGAWPVVAVDLDLDGDVDLLSGSIASDAISWYENQGNGTFGPARLISTAADRPQSVFAADLDGDGDPDALSASAIDNEIAWYENRDGRGEFGPRRIVSTNALEAVAVRAADLDGDGDADVVSASAADDRIAWYENHGDDCNGNQVPDTCERDCDANGVVDDCDLREADVVDCDGNGEPDTCQILCRVDCDSDGDGCPDETDGGPLDPQSCGDADGDGCDDCTSGEFAPGDDGLDGDDDGFCDPGDCEPANAATWSSPSSITDLRLLRGGGPASTYLVWSPPAQPGALAVVHDVLRAGNPEGLMSADCLEADDADTTAIDVGSPSPGLVFFYLIRVQSDCPGLPGNLGSDSSGTPREGRACDASPGPS